MPLRHDTDQARHKKPTMKAWPICRLGEVCTIEGGNPAPQGVRYYEGGTVPFVRMKDLGRYHFTDNLAETDDKLTPEAISDLHLKIIEPGCLLFPRSGSVALNHRAILGMRACVVSHIGILRNTSESLLGKFLYWYLQQYDMTRLSKKTTGVDSIAFADVARIEIPVPPLAEQERTVRILDMAEELRCLRQEADHRTADLIPALFNEMFGDPATNPKGWPTEIVSALLGGDRGGARCGPFGSTLKKHEYVDSGIPVWGIPNVLPNKFVEQGSLFITPAKYEQLRTYSVESGDLLVSRAGTVGRICVARPSMKYSIIGTNLVKLVLNKERISPEFFAVLLTHFGDASGSLRANMEAGSYSFMNTATLKALKIILPPLQRQQEFAACVAEIRAMEERQVESRRRLDDLAASLLHRAFVGEL